MTEPISRYGPRERILALGELRLSDAECLALVLRTGRPGENAEQMAQRLLRQFGGLGPLAGAAVREMAATPGLGPTRAAAVAAAFGLARRLTEARFRPGVTVRDGRVVARIVRDTAHASQQEQFFALLLDSRHRVLGLRVIATGGINSAPVQPRDVFAAAIRDGAAALVVAHNHPSGDPAPSPEDRAVTDRLRAAAELIGVVLLDHIVVGRDAFFSFADQAVHKLSI